MKSKSAAEYEPSDNNKTEKSFLSSLSVIVFKHMNEGVAVIGKDGNLLDSNPAFLNIFGAGEEEARYFVKQPAAFFNIFDFGLKELPLEESPFERIKRNKAFRNEKFVIKQKKTKESIFISCTGLPQLDETGNFICGILIIHDISEHTKTKFSLEHEANIKNEYHEQLEKYQQQLKDDRYLLQSIIDTIPVMITIYDSRIESVLLNKAVEKIIGWTNDNTQKSGIMKLAYPDPVYRSQISNYMKSLEPGFRDIIMRTKDGRDIETSWANVKIPDGRLVGVGIDISTRKKMERELIKAKQKAEKENHVQYAFIQNISHEVRTPMNSILGFTELLYQTMQGRKETEFLDAIAYNGRQLLRLIDDIIDFSRLDKNELSLSKEPFYLNDFMVQIRKQFPGLKSQYKKKKLRTVVEIPANAHGILVSSDVSRLQQVLINLISNAVKYTPEGLVEVGCEIRENNNEILFYVKDTGIGIDPKDHDRVFERFNRFHNTSKTEFRGTGLGLAISKHLVKLLGGEIWFESKPGRGSVFYFTHPCSHETPEVEATIEAKDEKDYSLPDLSGKTILIAEDDNFSYMMMYHMLTETKAKVLHAETGLEALEILQEENIDLLFLDIRLPELNGFQVIKKLRMNGVTIPVVAQTANALEEDRDKVKTAGFNYHAVKPVSQGELFSILNKYL